MSTLRSADNQVWTNILAKSEAKYEFWLLRVHVAFESRVAALVAKNKAPNLRNSAYQYRDEHPELVMRAAFLFKTYEAELKQIFSAKEFASLRADFLRGARDVDLLSSVRVMDKNFKLQDIRFVQLASCAETPAALTDVSNLDQAQTEALLAEFNLFYETLRVEQSAWRRYVAADKLYSQQHSSDTTTYLEKVHDTVVEATKEHMDKFYHIEAFQELTQGIPFTAHAMRALCDLSPPCPADSVPRLSVWNLPCVGPKLQLSLKQFQAAVATDLMEHPDLAAHIVIMPNCSKFGATRVDGHALQTAVQEFKDVVLATLKEIPDTLAIPCVGLYDSVSMYSPIRELKVDFLLVLHASAITAGNQTSLRSVWARSELYKRRCLTQMVEVMPRAAFKDWNQKILTFDRGHFSEGQELRQWHSGTGLLTAIVQAATRGLNLNQDSRVMVKDMTLYDDQLAASLLGLNCSKGKGAPLFGYTGIAWGNLAKARVRAQNVTEAIHELLVGRVKADPTALPYLKCSSNLVAPAPIFDSSQRPTYNEEQYAATCPRSNQELPIRQSWYDKFSGKNFLATTPAAGRPAMTWDLITAQHNKEFNVAGVPHKAKRLSDDSVEAVAAANPDPASLTPSGPGEPQDEAALVEARAVLLGSGNAAYKYAVSEDGHLYLCAQDDFVLPHTDSLFVIKGEAKQGQAAVKAMKDTQNWVPYKLEPNSPISVTFTAPVRGTFSEDPLPLREFLQRLEEAGHVRVSVHLHTAIRDPTTPGSYTITQADGDTACIQVKVEENLSESGELSYAKLGNYVDIPALKACPQLRLVHRFQFNPNINKLMSGFPAVYPDKPLKIEKGKVYKLF